MDNIKHLPGVLFYFNRDIKALITYLTLSKNQKYAFFQKHFYNKIAKKADYELDVKRDILVGSYEQQNEWKDYDRYLLKDVNKSFKNKVALDFGCGPCRAIIKYQDRFKRIDGVDISEELLRKGRENLRYHKVKIPNLYITNGYDLKGIKDNTYDFVMSMICLQHICVYSTRFNLLKELYRVMKPGAKIAVQMGFGKNSPQTVNYYDDNYFALVTNRGCDARIESQTQLKKDFEKIGFKKFTSDIRPAGPGDLHPKWIFARAEK